MTGRVTLIEGSITDIDLLNRSFEGVDGVFHEAAIVSVPWSVEHPVETAAVNVIGTLNVLIAARDCGVKKVVLASSSAVYGDNPELPKREEMLPEPKSPYALSKLTGEYLGSVFTRSYGLDFVAKWFERDNCLVSKECRLSGFFEDLMNNPGIPDHSLSQPGSPQRRGGAPGV